MYNVLEVSVAHERVKTFGARGNGEKAKQSRERSLGILKMTKNENIEAFQPHSLATPVQQQHLISTSASPLSTPHDHDEFNLFRH